MIFVWPTQWRYFTWKVGATEIPIRSHRFTEATQRLTLDGWVKQDATSPSPIQEPALNQIATPARALEPSPTASGYRQIDVEARKNFSNNGTLYVDIYNGSSKEVAGVELEVSRTDGGASRLFQVDEAVHPKQSLTVNFSSGLEDTQIGEVRLVSVLKPTE